jgi:hypothetical protein
MTSRLILAAAWVAGGLAGAPVAAGAQTHDAATVNVSARFAAPLAIQPVLEGLHLEAEGIGPSGDRLTQPMTGAPSPMVISTRFPEIFLRGDYGLRAQVTIPDLADGAHVEAPVKLDPCTLVVDAQDEVGSSAANAAWSVEDGQGHRATGMVRGWPAQVALPPGAYAVQVAGAVEPPRQVTLRYTPRCAAVVHFTVLASIRLPDAAAASSSISLGGGAAGALRADLTAAAPTLFASLAPPPLALAVRDAAGVRTPLAGPIGMPQSLPAGDYALLVGDRLSVPGVRVGEQGVTTVAITLAPGRLLVRLTGASGQGLHDDSVVWTVTPLESAAPAVTLTGATLDQRLPAGRYGVEARRGDVAVALVADLSPGRMMVRDLPLR